MSDITITNGLPADSPWTLANSDASKLDQANLINLAVGQLALLGASQGLTLEKQTGVLKELIGGVDTVNKQLDFLSTPDVWSETTPDFGYPDSGIGVEINPELLKNQNLLTQIIDATTKMHSLNVFPRANDGFTYVLNIPPIFGPASNLSMISKKTISATSLTGKLPESLLPSEIKFDNPSIKYYEGQIINIRTSPTSTPSQYVFLFQVFLKIDGGGPLNLTMSSKADFIIPKNSDELFSWELQASHKISQQFNPSGLSSAQLAMKNTLDLVSDLKILAPNTLPIPDPLVDNYPTNSVTMKIDAGTNYDMAEYTVSITINKKEIIYGYYPPNKVKDIDLSLLIDGNENKIFQDEKGAINYVYRNSDGNLSFAGVKAKLFFFKPTSDQIISWKSQYAEKIIVITQRSSDQQLFVNNLAQKYQYAFDAATYVLKAFTAMLTSAANNV